MHQTTSKPVTNRCTSVPALSVAHASAAQPTKLGADPWSITGVWQHTRIDSATAGALAAE